MLPRLARVHAVQCTGLAKHIAGLLSQRSRVFRSTRGNLFHSAPSLTSTFICRQADASYGAPFPNRPCSEQKNIAALISVPFLFSHQQLFFPPRVCWRARWHRTRQAPGTGEHKSGVTLIVPPLIKPYLTPVLRHH